mgnify:CR=1 FL=1
MAGDAIKRRVEEQMEELWPTPAHWVVASAAEAGVTGQLASSARLDFNNGADALVF